MLSCLNVKKEVKIFVRFILPLESLGARVWLDSKVLMPGDSLSRSINQGLAHVQYGIVILSKDYMKKFWTGKELEGLFAKWSGLDNGKKWILPVWHIPYRKSSMSSTPKASNQPESYGMNDISACTNMGTPE